MKKTKNKIKIIILGLAVVLVAGFGINKTAEAVNSSVYVSPTSLSKKVGDTFNMTVNVNPNGQKVCVVEGKLNLNKLSCQKVTMGSGISAQTSPSCGNLSFLLGIQGCITSNKTLFTVTVKAKKAGTGTATFTGVNIIGEGVSISSASAGGSYTISLVSSCNCVAWGSWENDTCGGGSCSSTQQLQIRTRTCVPSGCSNESESRCVDDSSCSVVSGQKVPGEKLLTKKRATLTREIPQESLLASLVVAFGTIAESAVLTTIITLCLIVLALIGFREWTLVQGRKKEIKK